MRTIVGFGNLLLFVLNVSALGAIAYKGQLWKSESEEPSSIEEVLDLTPVQTQAIETQRRSFNANWVQIEDEMQEKRGRLLAALREEGSDPQMLWPLVDELSQLQAELEKQAVTQIFQERQVMTPSQQERYFIELGNRVRQGCGCSRRYRSGRSGLGEQPEVEPPLQRGKGRGRGRRDR